MLLTLSTRAVRQRWNGRFFEAISLSSIGVVIQLGHGGLPCPSVDFELGDAKGIRFTILHTNGLHTVPVYFCDCLSQAVHFEQLLRAGLFPATVLQPKTCATFTLMRQAHITMLESRLSSMHMYTSLKRMTDNAGLSMIIVCAHYVFQLDLCAVFDICWNAASL
jgi:hypothetical protein